MEGIRKNLEIGVRSIPLRSEGGEMAVAHIMPIANVYRDLFNTNAEFSHLFDSACAMLIITPIKRNQNTNYSIIRGLFDLTAAEAKVTDKIGSGANVNETANELGVSAQTVRTHLKSIFLKTGVNSQAQLVSLLSGVAIIPTHSRVNQS